MSENKVDPVHKTGSNNGNRFRNSKSCTRRPVHVNKMADVIVPFRPWVTTDSNIRNNVQRMPVLPPPPAAAAALDLSICGKKPEAKAKENVTNLNGRVNKRMSREKRIQANTRERVRVHEITAAFESLRQTIPSYSNSQKLSKLSILRVACSYINALKQMNNCAQDCNQAEMNEIDSAAISMISKTIQVEGKLRTSKPNN